MAFENLDLCLKSFFTKRVFDNLINNAKKSTQQNLHKESLWERNLNLVRATKDCAH